MATRSTISMQRKDGTIAKIYCHWDGYLENNGKILLEHYKDPEKIAELIELGSLSQLGKEIGHKHDFDETVDRNWCKAYGRDRGESDVAAVIFKDLQDFYENAKGEEYNYLWIGGQWYGQSSYFADGKWLALLELFEIALAEEAE